MEDGGRHYVGQKTEETTTRERVGCLYIRVGNTQEEENIQIA